MNRAMWMSQILLDREVAFKSLLDRESCEDDCRN